MLGIFFRQYRLLIFEMPSDCSVLNSLDPDRIAGDLFWIWYRLPQTVQMWTVRFGDNLAPLVAMIQGKEL